jgi:hypothetical protein
MDLKIDMLRNLGAADPVVAFKTSQMLSTMAMASTAPDKSALRAEVAGFLAGELNATDPGGKDDKGKDKPPVQRYSTAVRNQVARLLGIVAGAAEVPALAQAMKDLDLRESARCALDRNRSPEATDALLAALAEVGPAFRVGVVGSLGDRGGERVTRALQGLADDEDVEVRLAAADALAKIPDAGNDAVLSQMSKQACPCTRETATKARIRLAETLARAGDKSAARRILQDIRQSDAAAPQKKAAEIGLKGLG